MAVTDAIGMMWKFSSIGDKLTVLLMAIAPPLVVLSMFERMSLGLPVWNGFWVFFPFFVVVAYGALFGYLLIVFRECKRRDAAGRK